MNTNPRGYAEKMPLFYAATQEAVRANPDLRPSGTDTPEESTRTVASLLAQGDCGMAVFWGGRELAKHLLPLIAQTEHYDTCAALHVAIERGSSLLDELGEPDCESKTPTCIDWLAGKAEASESAIEVEPLPSVARICRIMEQAYEEHPQSLPAALFEPLYASLGLGTSQAPTFREFASQLYCGLAGGVVFQLGREFCRQVLMGLEAIGASDLCPVLRQAVAHGESNWDTSGYLPLDSLETNLPDCNGSYAGL